MNKMSLKVCTVDRTPICELYDNTEYRVRNIVEKLSINEITTLTFDLPIANPKWKHLANENLILFNDEYYKIKKPTFFHDEDGKLYVQVECKHYSDNLANDLISLEETTPRNVIDLMKLALCYDTNGLPTKGWTVGTVTVDRVAVRGLEVMEQSPFSVLLTIAEKYDGILKFNSKTMTVDMLERESTEHPTIDLRVSKNLKSFEISYDTSEMYTRLYCYGAADDDGNELDIMSVNPTGKAYIDNFDYFKSLGYEDSFIAQHPEIFVSTNIWRDDNYYDAQDLYEDGIKELAKIAQPVVDVKITALDTKAMGLSDELTQLDLGACVRVYDEDLGADTLCNVISREINYEEPHILNAEVTNSVTYHDTLSKLFTDVNTVSSVVTSGGNIIGGSGGISMDDVEGYLNLYYLNAETIEAKFATINELQTNYLTAEQIKATYIDAESIAAQYATIGELNAIKAIIEDLDVETLTAQLAKFEEMYADYGEFKKLIATDAEFEEIEAGTVTIYGTLKAANAEIDDLKATKVEVGDFNAYKATIEQLFALYASIEYLEANYLKATQIEATYAKITSLDALEATIDNLKVTVANVETLVAGKASIEDLNAVKITVEQLVADVAEINTIIANVVTTEYLEAELAKINTLITDQISAVNASIAALDAKFATIEQLNAEVATINTLIAQKADIEDLNAAVADIGELNALVANINTILSGSIGAGIVQTIHLTAQNVVIDDAVIKSANIESLDVNKINAGVISTNKFQVQSDDGGFKVVGNTTQWTDATGKVRMQAGRDAEGNFNFSVFGADGTTAIFDENGIHEAAVPDGIIRDDMVADDANIQASKIQYISSEGNKTLQTIIDIQQGSINALISNTTIDGESLKDKFTQLQATVDGLSLTVGDVQTDMENMSSKMTDLEVKADGIFATVSNMRIGGQNLFYYSSREWTAKETDSSLIFLGCYMEQTDNDMEGKTVTLSFEVQTTETTTGTLAIYYYGTKLETEADLFLLKDNIALTELVDGKYKYTFEYPTTAALTEVEEGTTPMFTMVVSVAGITGDISIRKGMLQYGNTATEWIPSSDNVEDSVAKVEITADKINWVVKSGTSESNFELTDRTATLVANQINLKGLVTFSGLSSEVQDKFDEIDAKDPDNLIPKYYFPTGEVIDPWVVNSLTTALGQTDPYGGTNAILLTPTGDNPYMKIDKGEVINQTGLYTFSVWLKSNKEGTVSVYINVTNGKEAGKSQEFEVGTAWKLYTMTVDVTDLNLFYDVLISGYYTWTDTTFNLYVYRPKLVYGTGLGVVDMWTQDAAVFGNTTINGGFIKTQTIKTDQLAVDEILAENGTFLGIINAQDINANRITSGTISANRISVYGLSVLQRDTEIETFNIDNNGNVTVRGSVESYNYIQGQDGWSIKANGDAEFNDVTVRGDLIGNYGGIMSLKEYTDSGETEGRNLLIDSDRFVEHETYFQETYYFGDVKPVNGETYTLSFKANIDENWSQWYINRYDGSPAETDDMIGSFTNINEENIYYYTFIWAFSDADNNVGIQLNVLPSTSHCSVEWIKLEEGSTATPWTPAPEDIQDQLAKEVVFWAGESYEQREYAPFKVYADGSIDATKGTYSGIWTGDVRIGNITISDPSNTVGNDALLTIRNGQNGIYAVRLTDSTTSTFAQNIEVTDNFYNPNITFNQDGTAFIKNRLDVGTSNGYIRLSSNVITIGDTGSGFSSIYGYGTGIKFAAPNVAVGELNNKSSLTVYGESIMDGILKLKDKIEYGNVIACTASVNGIDFNIITENFVSVQFNTDGGSIIPSQNIAIGGKVLKPSNPTKEGYVFAGWYKESTFTTEFNFNTETVSESIIIYAKWLAAAQKPNVTGGHGYNAQATNGYDGSIVPAKGMIINATSPDGGTLTYDWNCNLYSGSAGILAREDIFSSITGNEVTIADFQTYAGIDLNNPDTSWMYETVSGSVTVTNTKNNTTASVTYWVGNYTFEKA